MSYDGGAAHKKRHDEPRSELASILVAPLEAFRMPIKWVRGFRRIGWVVTVPLAALIVLPFYEQTIEVSGYESKQIETEREAQPWERTVELVSTGRLRAPFLFWGIDRMMFLLSASHKDRWWRWRESNPRPKAFS